MHIPLEDLVPYDQSLQWRIHDTWFARRGASAWTGGHVPFEATSNYAQARQQALLVLQAVQDLEEAGTLAPEAPVFVLEMGAGLGRFAQGFLRALRRGSGEAGRALLPRLRYILSDYTESALRDAATSPELAPEVACGRLIPALFDLRRPDVLCRLDGTPFDVPIAAIVANYLCCVSPVRIFRKTPADFEEKLVAARIWQEDDEPVDADALRRRLLDDVERPDLMGTLDIQVEWRPVDPREALPDALHGEMIQALLSRFETAAIAWPHVFLDALLSLRNRALPGALVLINDYGHSEIEELEGLEDVSTEHFGNTMNLGVQFALFDVFCERTGLALHRTRNELRSVHSAAIHLSPTAPPGFEEAFHRIMVEREDGEDLLLLSQAARTYIEQGDYRLASRFYHHCLRLDPEDRKLLYAFGLCCIEAGRNRTGLAALQKGLALDTERSLDFEFQIGRTFAKLQRYDEALAAYRRSLSQEEHHVTYTNLALIYEQKGDLQRAYACCQRALQLDPDHGPADQLLQSIQVRWTAETLGKGWEALEIKDEPRG